MLFSTVLIASYKFWQSLFDFMREIHRAEEKTALLYITYEIILLQRYNILLNISEEIFNV